MSENRPSTLYVGLLLGAMVLIGFTMVQADLFDNYGQTPENLDYLEVSEEVASESRDLRNRIETWQPTGIEPLDAFIAGTYGTLRLLFGISDIYTTFASNVGNVLGIPAALITIAVALVLTSIVFAIISTITKMRV